MERLDGQVAIVTGGARGIGRGIATVLAGEGARVAIADLDRDAAERTATELPGGAIGVGVDVVDRAAVEAMAATVLERCGRIDVLAANAGIYPATPLEQIDDAEWDRVMDLNAKGALHAVQACLATMREHEYGRVVLTSSITGPITGHPGYGHYGASKAAMLGFMRSAAIELAGDGITINAVMPGNVRTPGLEEAGEEHQRQMLASIPLRDFADPTDIGWAVRFLGSPEARYITGQT
ncbi:MAG: glucose 1-dehydrogenase, partial [Actinobacteria bacterium]|nr:glucose 1-dehydrogenase [Actinomycetota bacterium]